MLFTNLVIGAGSFSSEASEAAAQSVYYAYPTAFTPAPFTFAIWLPIFLGTVWLAFLQALPRHRSTPHFDRFAPFYVLGLLANAVIPFVPIGWSIAVVGSIFVAMVTAYLELTRDGAAPISHRAPVVLFATWALVATVLNTCQFLVSLGIDVGAPTATVLVGMLMLLGAWAVWQTRELTIFAVMAWTGLGLAAAQSQSFQLVVWIGLTTLVSAAVAVFALRGERRSQTA